MTAIAQLSTATIPANEDLLISQLHAAFKTDFKIRSVAAADGTIQTAQINTDASLDPVLIKKLAQIAAEWKLKLLISFFGAGLKIYFKKH